MHDADAWRMLAGAYVQRAVLTGDGADYDRGWKMLDNDNTHAFYVFPAGSTIAPGAYLVVDISTFFGAFTTTGSSTKGAANDCGSGSPVKINEVESNLGIPGDWVELYNPSAAPANVSGFVFKDNDDTHSDVIPGGTTIAAGGLSHG